MDRLVELAERLAKFRARIPERRPDRLDERDYHRFGHRIEWRRNAAVEHRVLAEKQRIEEAA